jgi:RNA polymerase sigma-70 factor (ECF subfamily)
MNGAKREDDREACVRARVDAAARGDRRAAHALLVELLPRARNLVRYLVRGDRDVDDIAQDALVAVVRGLASYRGDGAFTAWADRIVARTTFAAIRARRLHEANFGESDDEESSEVASNEADPLEYLERRRIVAHLDRLPQEQRHALVLHHVLEMSVPEAAHALGIPEETFRSRLRLARTRMRSFEDDGKPACLEHPTLAVGAEVCR